MSGVFLSHSSADKPFVKRLAVDLVNRGIPVWFDSWDIELGESLLQKIYSGIDNSAYLVIILSNSSVESGWVQKELNAALAKEDEIKKEGEMHHPFVLPIRIDRCKVPLQVADRLYADFSDSYLPALEKLTEILKHHNAHTTPIPPEQQLIPLSFTRGIYLRDTPLASRIISLLPTLPAGYSFNRNQFVLDNPDETYSTLRTRLIQRVEHIAEDPNYTPELERKVSSIYESVLSVEERLLNGIQLIINEVAVNRQLRCSFSEACHWFARLEQMYLYITLCNAQDTNLEDLVKRREEWISMPLFTEDNAQNFFGIKEVVRVDIGPAPTNSQLMSDSFGVWVDRKERFVSDIISYNFFVPEPILSAANPECFSKYVIPQMLDLYFDRPYIPLTWNFKGYLVGIH